MSSDTIVNLVVGLGAALIGAASAFGAIGWQGRQQAKAAEADARERAYVDLLVSSVSLAIRVRSLLTTVETRSGIKEGIAVTLGQRKELDPMTLQEWLDVDYRPLMDAWSRAWACGTPEGIELSNRLMDACRGVIAVMAQVGPTSRSGAMRLALFGVKTAEQVALYDERLAVLATARRDLADLVRRETGRPPAQLFSATE